MMLDQKQAFDEVVAAHAQGSGGGEPHPREPGLRADLELARRRARVRRDGQAPRLRSDGRWDTIVVDTPPTANALDFLDAPRKLAEAIDSPAVDWFRKLQGGSGGWSLVGKTGSFVLKRLAKFVGSQFLDDISVFFTEFNDILGGFRTRADETFALLRQPRVGFVLVASPEPMAVREALFFHERLLASAMPFVGFIVNKVHAQLPVKTDATALAAALAADPAVAALGLSGTTHAMAAQALLAAHTRDRAARRRRSRGDREAGRGRRNERRAGPSAAARRRCPRRRRDSPGSSATCSPRTRRDATHIGAGLLVA